MNGLSIVQALLALIFYKSCPQQLIAMVFSSEFIKRLEQEISMCYSKNTYPQKVMNQVMQLNRAVCLDCPEVNVKWFQQSYMEAQASKLPTIHSKLHTEVKNVLLDIVKGPQFLMIDRVTPYGYKVDFELTIDQYNRFVHPLPEDYNHVNYNANLSRIAILLLNNKVLCDNDMNRLKGSELLRLRHLEMMGYRVIHVKISEFNSLYKNVSAKIKYLKNLLQLTA
jgi:FAST kinase-like protein, subdomain 2/RAP domain